MLQAILLDASPLSLASQRQGNAEAAACRLWLGDCMRLGVRILVPEVADYEVRRELIRTGRRSSLVRLDHFNDAVTGRYLPLTTAAMRHAALLWAQVRQAGAPTADPHALDADVILAAQALTLGIPAADLVVATSNPRHLARFLPADLWRNITP
jgi:predicted nucleic acid-binding protein